MKNKLYIMVGLPGSGKTTNALKTGFLRICQDELGSRNACILKLIKHLKQYKENIIIDRTNITRLQRKTFIDIGKAFGYEVICCYMHEHIDVCLQRILNRKDHPTFDKLTDEKKQDVVIRFYKELEPPSKEEGFKEIIGYILNE